MMKLKITLSSIAVLLSTYYCKAVDPSVSVFLSNPVYKSARVFEFDVMMKANAPTASFQLRTFQSGLYLNSAWVNGGTISAQNVNAYSAMSSPGYNGKFQWNATDKVLNCSVNFDVYTGPSTCVSTTVTTTPIMITKIRLTNTADFSCAAAPDIKFNYVSNASPLRLRTSFSWREVACTTNYDMFYPGRTYGGSATFNGEVYTAADADGKSPISTIPMTGFCESQLKVTALLQGYYLSGGIMQPVLANQGRPHASLEETDSITIELKFPSLPDYSKKVILNIDGSAYMIFPPSYIGQTCYIVIKHRNSIQTWSSSPVTLSNRTSYNFANAATAAFGNNMIMVEPSYYAIFAGDINQDEYIDIFDFPQFDLDNQNFVAYEYAATDLNGDGFVDIFDFPVFDLNNQNFVFSIHP